jgi:hypothetical protein
VDNQDARQEDRISAREWIAKKRAELGLNETPTDSYLYELKKQRFVEEWDAWKKAEAERERIAQQQAELESYLSPRRQRWVETTGSAPPPDVLRRWQMEFVDGKEFEKEAARWESIREAYVGYPWDPSLD